jgi:TPP-dependent pyruvate/acetoin dehydrogenase alpha subunit
MNLSDFNSLLQENSLLQKSKTKWTKSLNKGHVALLKQLYTLRVTDNKRKLIYKNGKLIKTIPYIINNNKEIIN